MRGGAGGRAVASAPRCWWPARTTPGRTTRCGIPFWPLSSAPPAEERLALPCTQRLVRPRAHVLVRTRPAYWRPRARFLASWPLGDVDAPCRREGGAAQRHARCSAQRAWRACTGARWRTTAAHDCGASARAAHRCRAGLGGAGVSPTIGHRPARPATVTATAGPSKAGAWPGARPAPPPWATLHRSTRNTLNCRELALRACRHPVEPVRYRGGPRRASACPRSPARRRGCRRP